jgi:hypothetical protein
MAHGLSMAPDCRDGARANSGTREQPANHRCVKRGQFIGEKGSAVQFVVARLMQFQDARAQPHGKRQSSAFEKTQSIAVRSGKHRVDTVQAGPGHQPDVELEHRESVTGDRP